MKENYVYSDGKVISTEKASGGSENYDEDTVVGDDRIVIRDYQDNIEDIFILENLIEELQKNEVERILESKEKAERLQKNDDIYISIFTSMLFLPFCFCSFNLQPIVAFLFWAVLSSSIIGGTYYFEKLIKKKIKKELAGIDLELKETRKETLKVKEKLADLRKIKTRNNEETIKNEKTKKINYKEKLKELREYLNIFYNIGYNEEELNNHYDQGTLQNELHNEQHIQLVKKYFDSKKTTI